MLRYTLINANRLYFGDNNDKQLTIFNNINNCNAINHNSYIYCSRDHHISTQSVVMVIVVMTTLTSYETRHRL